MAASPSGPRAAVFVLPLYAMATLHHAWPALVALSLLAAPTHAARQRERSASQTGGAGVAGSGFSFSRQPIQDVKVEAEHFDGTADAAGVVRASGHVRAVLTQAPEPGQEPVETVITADALMADLGAKFLTADGAVTVESAGRTARGEHLEYHWAEQAGHVESVELRQFGLAFRAQRLIAKPNRQTIVGAEFSTCDLDDPDYALHARRVEIIANKRIVAHGVTLELFQHRLFTIPRLQYTLRNGRARSATGLPVARPGYSRVSGFSIAQPLPLGPNVDAELEPTTRVGVRGRVAWQPEQSAVAPYATLEWRQEHAVRGRDPVLVSAVPRIGLRLGRNQTLDLNAGYFIEKPTGAREGRADLSWRRTLIDRGVRPGLRVSVDARLAAYTTGDVYRTVGLEAAVGRGNADVFEAMGVRLNNVEGRTPFLWDEVQVRTELFGEKRIPWGKYRLYGLLRYDAERHEMYDMQVGVARRFKCLEPEIRYSTRRRFLLFNLRVPGLE